MTNKKAAASTMLYRSVGKKREPGSTVGKPCHIECEYKIFSGDDVAKKQKDGWMESPFDTLKVKTKDKKSTVETADETTDVTEAENQ